MRDRYAQCDDTCTTDCGHCKGDHALTRPWRAIRMRSVMFVPGVADPAAPTVGELRAGVVLDDFLVRGRP